MDWPYAFYKQMNARFDRPPIHSSRPNISTRPAANGASSFASILKGNPNNFNHIASSPAMVLDDECVVERDLDNFVIGEVKIFIQLITYAFFYRMRFPACDACVFGGLWDDSVNDAEEINGNISKQMNLDDESDIEGVSDTVFDDKADSLGHEHT
ncbi:hypothetical protein Tco_1295401 [Tanacetum coccineum]